MWWKNFCCSICVTLLWALHIVIKQQFFLHLLQYNAILHTAAITIMLQICPVSNIMTDLQYNKFCYVLNGTMRNRRKFSHSGDFDDNSSTYGCNTEPT